MEENNLGSQTGDDDSSPRPLYRPPEEPTGESQASPRKVYRSREQKMVAGVAGGLGQYFGVDPTLVRLAFVLVALLPGVGGISVVGYIILAIVVPQRPLGEVEPLVASTELDTNRGRQMVGIGLVVIGLLALSGALGLFDVFNWRFFWPLLLIGLGGFLLLRPRS